MGKCNRWETVKLGLSQWSIPAQEGEIQETAANDCLVNVVNSPVKIYLSNCLLKERLQKGVVTLAALSTSYHFWSGILVHVKTPVFSQLGGAVMSTFPWTALGA